MSTPGLDEAAQNLFAGMDALGLGAKKRRKRFNTSHIALQSTTHSSRTMLDTDMDLTVPTTPKREKTERATFGVQSPRGRTRLPRLAYPLAGAESRRHARLEREARLAPEAFRMRGGGPEKPKAPTDPRLRLSKADKARKKAELRRKAAAGKAEMAVLGADIAQRQRDLGVGRQTLVHIRNAIRKAQYPNPTEGFYRAAEHVLLQHKVPHTVWETFAPAVEKVLRKGKYKHSAIDIVRDATEATR